MKNIKIIVSMILFFTIVILYSSEKYFDYEIDESDGITIEKIIIRGFTEKEINENIISLKCDSVYLNEYKYEYNQDKIKINPNKYSFFKTYYTKSNLIQNSDKYLNQIEKKCTGISNKLKRINNNLSQIASNIYLIIVIPYLIYWHNDTTNTSLQIFTALMFLIGMAGVITLL